jgi:hypothetical protein
VDVDQKKIVKKDLLALNINQRRFFREYIRTGKRTDAYMKVYRTKDRINGSVNAYHLCKSHPEIMNMIYEAAGIGDDDLVRTASESLKAMRQIPRKDGKDSQTIEEFPDPYARLKAVEVAQKLRGINHDTPTNQVNIQIISDEKAGIFKVIEGEES